MTKNQITNNSNSESFLEKQKLTSIALRIIGAILLFLALSKMPYGYYTFLRWSIMILSAVFAYDLFQKDNSTWGWIFIAVAILFNPIVPVYFQRSTWRVINIVTGIIFLVSIQTVKNK